MQFRHLSVNLLPKTTAVILIIRMVVLYYTYTDNILTIQYFCSTFELHTIYGYREREKLLDRNCYAAAVTF